jgi:6-phosphogluconate dehydrogenase
MQIGVVGLGRMGGNIVRRLMQHCTKRPSTTATPRRSKCCPAKAPWARAGFKSSRASSRSRATDDVTEGTVRELSGPLEPGDVILDGGKDDIRRAGMLKQRGLHYVDVGTNRGVLGLERAIA